MTDCLLDTLLMLCNKWLQVPNGCPYYFLVWIQHYGCYGRPKLNPTCSSKVVSGPLAKRECCWWSANARPALWEGHGPSSASLSCSTAQYALRSKMESINESDGQSSTWGWKSCRIILLIATWICAQGMPQTMDSWRCRKPQEKNHFHKNHPPKSLIFLGKTIGSWDFETPRLAPRPRRARPRDSDCVGRNCGASSAASVIGASKTAKHQPGHGLHMISYDFSHVFTGLNIKNRWLFLWIFGCSFLHWDGIWMYFKFGPSKPIPFRWKGMLYWCLRFLDSGWTGPKSRGGSCVATRRAFHFFNTSEIVTNTS